MKKKKNLSSTDGECKVSSYHNLSLSKQKKYINWYWLMHVKTDQPNSFRNNNCTLQLIDID